MLYEIYKFIAFYFIILFIITVLLFSASFFLIKRKDSVEKLKPYECGFNPYNDARKMFHVNFYLIALLFIIFDIELIFLFPWSITLEFTGSFGYWVMIEFLIELIIGFMYVWSAGALDWEN